MDHRERVRYGNVLSFGGPAAAGADYEHMRAGALSDGYVLCYRNPTTNAYVNAFDVGSAESGFGAATPTDGGAADMGVVRATSDGVLTLEQGFSFHGKEKRMVLMNVGLGLSRRTSVQVRAAATSRGRARPAAACPQVTPSATQGWVVHGRQRG